MRPCPLGLQGDPYKTIIVSRLSYDVTDKKLRREFEEFGPIKRIRLVTDTAGGVGAPTCAQPSAWAGRSSARARLGDPGLSWWHAHMQGRGIVLSMTAVGAGRGG